MHLGARVPNEGARKIARSIARDFGGDLDRAAARMRTSATFLQRMIDGTMEPGFATGNLLARLCGVRAGDFNRPAEAGWFDGDAARMAA